MQKPSIVVIDSYTINPGDLSWEAFEALGEVTVYERSSYEQAKQRLQDADIAVVNKVVFDQNMINALPSLKMISLSATGYNNLDIPALQQRGIIACHVKGYGDYAVAQHTIALLLELCNHTAFHAERVEAGAWAKTDDFCYYEKPMTELSGLTMGVIGWGNIGSKVGAIAAALGMRVIFYSKHHKQTYIGTQVERPEEIWKEADVISLNCLLTEETKEIINEDSIRQMKEGVIILNTSRGGLVNEAALYAGLLSGKIGGAGLDVLQIEPPKAGNLLIGAPNCVVTPHNAWAPKATRERLLLMAANNIRHYLEGKPVNVIT